MFSFQFNGEHLFHWHDREGNEKTLEIQDSLCNLKSNVLRTDHAQIRDKSHLPISKLLYGPHQLETEQMTITVSKLVCQQDHLENFETIEDQISETNAMITDLKEKVEEDDIEIRNLVKSQQDSFENHINVFNDLQEKVEDQGLKDSEFEGTLHDLKEDHEEKLTDLKKLIKEQSELTGKSLSEALLFAERGENMLCTKIVLNVRNNFCTQHVLPRFELGIFMY